MHPHLPQHNFCTACSACISVCPKHLITFTSNKTGFLIPILEDPTSCTECVLCEKACPVMNKLLPEYSAPKVFAASAKNDTELISSASGGVASVISRAIIRRGGVVFGVVYTDDFSRAEFKIAKNEETLEQFKGSKYIQADKNDIFKAVKEELRKEENKNKPVLFIGLPCEIAGLKTYLGEIEDKQRYNNLFTIDLICFGVTSPKVAEEYTKHLSETYLSRITNFSVRYKKDGKWTPPYLRTEFSNGNIFLAPFYNTEYGRAFNLLSRPSCNSCRFKGEHHMSDLTIGDFWGCTEQDSFWNPHGVSVIFAHSKNGMNLLSSITDLNLTESTYERAIEKNSMYVASRHIDAKQKQFAEDFVERGLFYASNKSIGIKEKTKNLVGKIIRNYSRSQDFFK